MNIYTISQDSTALNQIGYAIDTPQRIKLQMGLLRLTQLANADQLLFWGKIFTSATPYYIAVAIDFKGYYAFSHKRFFYANDTFNFKELPSLLQGTQKTAEQFNGQGFTGNPNHVLLNVQPEQGKQANKQNNEEVDSDEEVTKVEPRNFTEEDRLSYTVKAIEIECQIAPKGAYRMKTEHQIRYNDNFKSSSTKQLKDFVHFRYPLSESARQALQSPKSIFHNDIFDQLENQSFWSIQSNTSDSLLTVRSLLWPGYMAYLFTKRHVFGGIYVGNAIKNVDLPFFI